MNKILKGVFVITSGDYPDEVHPVQAELTNIDLELAVDQDIDVNNDWELLNWALLTFMNGEMEGECSIGEDNECMFNFEGYLLK